MAMFLISALKIENNSGGHKRRYSKAEASAEHANKAICRCCDRQIEEERSEVQKGCNAHSLVLCELVARRSAGSAQSVGRLLTGSGGGGLGNPVGNQ